MKFRAAVASSDGKVVNQHFGHAEQFLIFEFDGSQFAFVEPRTTAPVCTAGTHDENALSRTLRLISDCQFVVVNRIGPAAEQVLFHNGIRPYVDSDFIDEALMRLAKLEKQRVFPAKTRASPHGGDSLVKRGEP